MSLGNAKITAWRRITREPEFWAKALTEFMDLLVFLAIYLTTEVQTWPFAVAFGLSGVRLVTGLRFRTFWMGIGFIALLAGGYLLVTRMQTPPVVAAAHIAPIALTWIGLSQEKEVIWGWRLALGFIGLILASALSPDFSVTLTVVLFIVSSSIALACRFIASEFSKRGVVGTLPSGFIRTGLYQSGILFIAALCIFPLIPRVQGRGAGFGNDPATTGYTEEVNLSEWSRVSSKGSNAPALRIYAADGGDPSELIPSGFLRSRVLSILGANRWDALPAKIDPTEKKTKSDSARKLTIVREMIGMPSLPVPYGATNVKVELYGYRWPAEKTKAGEWREARSRNQRFNYTLDIDPLEKQRRPEDPPSLADSQVPNEIRSPRMIALANQIFQGVKTPQAKIKAIQDFYRRSDFKAMYFGDEPAPSENQSRLPPLERFLFVEKAGHCELFASAFAVLLRMGGVPSRLIAGFRVSRNPIGDVLTVRQSDAHAWLEAYLPGEGWTVIDPTPRILMTFSVSDYFRDTYDWASAKWTQYILNYGESETTLGAKWRSFKKSAAALLKGENPLKDSSSETDLYLFGALFLFVAFLSSFSMVAVIRRLKTRSRSGSGIDENTRILQRERTRFTKALQRKRESNASVPDPELESALTDWTARYEALRFGPRNADFREDFRKLKESTRKIESTLRML